MAKVKSLKKAFLTSAVALVMSSSMLVGTTFAWFTDSVTSANNKIVSGSLNVDLELMNKANSEWNSVKAEKKALFNYTNWEPGYTEVKILKVQNEGTLALNWKAQLVSKNGLSKLANVIEVYVNKDATTYPTDLAGWTKVGTLAEFVNNIESTLTGALEAGQEDVFGIAFHMQESAGNEYQSLALGEFDIQILASQRSFEADSFGKDYDQDATYPVTNAEDLIEALEAGACVTMLNDISVDADDTISVASGLSAVLDLNGYTLSGVSDKSSSNRDMLDVRGTLSIVNGTVEYTHAGANMGWASSTAVVNVTAGGILNLENAKIQNRGGSDMAIGIHMNNWGEVTLNANNSEISSTYCGVRMFNSGFDMNNVTITNSTIMSANMAVWVHNYIGDLDATKHPDAAIKARLNTNLLVANPQVGLEAGDKSNLNTAANNTILGKIRYGFGDSCEIYYVPDNSVQVVKDTASLETAINNVAEGDTIVLAGDVTATKTLAFSNKNFTLDGNGCTISQADDCTNSIAMFDITGGNVEIKNVTFDGIKGGAAIRTVGTETTIENCSFINAEHTFKQGFLRLVGKTTLTDCTFANNKCTTLITLNYDTGSNTPVLVENCTFENNTCNQTAVLYYVKGAGCTLKNNTFVNNNCNVSNGATVYMGFTENNVITGNVFKDNVVTATSVRSAGGLMVGHAATITNNAFINNKVFSERGNVLGNDVCASVYYADIDLSGNYWGGEAPVQNDNYFVEYPDRYSVIINDYLTEYNF